MTTKYARSGQVISGTGIQAQSDVLSIPVEEKLGNCIAYIAHDGTNHLTALGHLDTSVAMGSQNQMENLMRPFKQRVEAELARIGGNLTEAAVVVGGCWKPPQIQPTEWGYVRGAVETIFPNATHHPKAMARISVPTWEDVIVITDADGEKEGDDLDWN